LLVALANHIEATDLELEFEVALGLVEESVTQPFIEIGWGLRSAQPVPQALTAYRGQAFGDGR